MTKKWPSIAGSITTPIYWVSLVTGLMRLKPKKSSKPGLLPNFPKKNDIIAASTKFVKKNMGEDVDVEEPAEEVAKCHSRESGNPVVFYYLLITFLLV